MSTAPAQPATGSLADQLREVTVSLRSDLHVSRHVFHGEVCYVVRDPITFQSHSFDAGDYAVLSRLTGTRPLGEVFTELAGRGVLSPEREESFYKFILQLHRLTFLMLPINDANALYKRHEQNQTRKRRAMVKGFLFLRVPLWNPDNYLERTKHWFAPLFHPVALMFWAVLMFITAITVARQWEALANTFSGMLSLQGILLGWIILIGLKAVHEFGHAYCCKHFGGQVPEMGAYFIILTPCAYMDASAAWGFVSQWRRIAVSLAGMYFESWVAAAALFVWASTPPGMLNFFAFQTFFVASAVTLLFNANPLMRFDGYFILSDLIRVPNLRSRSTAYTLSLFNRATLGVTTATAPHGIAMRIFFVVFAIACGIYRVVLVLSICATIAAKFFLIGIGLAAFYCVSELFGAISRTCKFLWFDPRTATARKRGVALGVLLVFALPTILIFSPTPGHASAVGVIRGSAEHELTMPQAGLVEAVALEAGRLIPAGAEIMRIDNPQLDAELAVAKQEVRVAEARVRAADGEDAAAVRQALLKHAAKVRAWELIEEKQIRMTVRAPADGTLVSTLSRRDIGRWVMPGEPAAKVVEGPWHVHAVLDESTMAGSVVNVGDEVWVRPERRPDLLLRGTVTELAPAGSRQLPDEALSSNAGGPVPLHPITGMPERNWYRLTVRLDDVPTDAPTDALAYGGRASVKLPGEYTLLGRKAWRGLLRFRDRLMLGG
ncbi:MAG: hypothetical protein AAGD32_04170 [Planctomycetota bacterium]